MTTTNLSRMTTEELEACLLELRTAKPLAPVMSDERGEIVRAIEAVNVELFWRDK